MFKNKVVRKDEVNELFDLLVSCPDLETVLDYLQNKGISLSAKLAEYLDHPGENLKERKLISRFPETRMVDDWRVSSLLYYLGLIRITPDYQVKLQVSDFHALGSSLSHWKMVENVTERVKKPWFSKRATAFVSGAVQTANVEAIIWASTAGLKVFSVPEISAVVPYAYHLLKMVGPEGRIAERILEVAEREKSDELDAKILEILRDSKGDPFHYLHLMATKRIPMGKAWYNLLTTDWNRKNIYAPYCISEIHERHAQIQADPHYKEIVLSVLAGHPLEEIVQQLHSVILQEGRKATRLDIQLAGIAHADEKTKSSCLPEEIKIIEAIQRLSWS